MIYHRNVVHPVNCTCKMCTRKRKKQQKEDRKVIGSFYLTIIGFFIISSILI